jgi:hypothetical protein
VPHVSQIDEHELSQCHSSEQHICGPSVNTLTAPDIAHVYSGVGRGSGADTLGRTVQGAGKWVAKLIF